MQVIHTLHENDTLSLVSFSSSATTVFTSIGMTESGKAEAERKLESLAPSGQTNLWDGLLQGMQALKEVRPGSGRLGACLLLTDGLPNVAPPRGTVEMLKRFRAEHACPFSISTFGFGYRLDSKQLHEIAQEGEGMYAFIPDASFAGTAFINATSNLLTTMGQSATVEIHLPPGVSFSQERPVGEYEYEGGAESDTKRVQLGSLQYGQPRHAMVRVRAEPGQEAALDQIRATLGYQNRHSATPVQVLCEPAPMNMASQIAAERLRLEFVELLSRVLEAQQLPEMADPTAADLVTSFLKKLQATPKASGSALDGLFDDCKGQVREAVSRPDWYEKWGVHYLPSLRRAHQLEQCNNFKDPGLQHYGAALFQSLRDQADEIFANLPAPVPSRAAYASGSSGGGCRGGSAAPAAPIDMAQYNCSGNPCFSGDSSILLGDGTSVQLHAVRKGDQVRSGEGYVVDVHCVVKTWCREGKTSLVSLSGGLQITPWHPVKHRGEWKFPADIIPGEEKPCEAVYSLVLSSGHTVMIGGIECVTLGHELEGPVVGHEYLGTSKVIQDLKRFPGWEGGLVEFVDGCMVRDRASGLMCGWDASKLVQSEEEEEAAANGEILLNVVLDALATAEVANLLEACA